ncbi:MAG: amidohydrolase [Chlorobi bacterium]|nr:amidohydrolase [Chlorobiota bacterium]
MDIKKRIDEIFNELVAIRRDLHMHPELGFEEFRTGKKITEFLGTKNIEFQTGIAQTGIVGLIRGKKSVNNKTVALRADIDALPVTEETDLKYKSTVNGKMHACGHDVHTTILLGTAQILQEMKNEIDGNVKLIFQPAEETSGGAMPMIEDGVLENPTVDYVLGLHAMPYIDVGTVELKYGKLNASSDHVKITIKGESGHGAQPEKTIDSILVASHVIIALQTIVSRNISPSNAVVLSIGRIKGGVGENIIADNVTFSGILRTLDDETRNFAKKRIKEIAENQARAFGAEAIVEFEPGYESLINHNFVVDVIKEESEKLLGKKNVVFKDAPGLGVEDFSYFTNRVPGAFYHLGCGNSKKNIDKPLHSNKFEVDEECIKYGILLQVNATLKLLANI